MCFTLNGARVPPDKFGKLIAKTMMATSSMRCPEHRKAPMVVVDAARFGYPGVRIAGCCQGFIETIAERLNNTF